MKTCPPGSKSIDEIGLWEQMELPREPAPGVCSDVPANIIDVGFQRLFIRRQRRSCGYKPVRKLVANPRFLVIGDSCKVHGRTRDVMLPVRSDIYEGVGAHRVLPGAALHEVKSASRNE